MHLQTVTDLVNNLFTYYDCNLSQLDWDNKINEYVDVITDLITYDTDLDELYKTIRQDYKYRKLPTPYDIKQILTKTKAISEIREYAEHPDNGKQIVIVCYRGGIVREVRTWLLAPGGQCRTQREIASALRDIYDDIKVYEYGKDTTIYRDIVRLADGTISTTAEAWVPSGYDSNGNITGYDKQRIA